MGFCYFWNAVISGTKDWNPVQKWCMWLCDLFHWFYPTQMRQHIWKVKIPFLCKEAEHSDHKMVEVKFCTVFDIK